MRKNEQLVRIIGNPGLPFADRSLLLGLDRKATQARHVKVSNYRKDVTILHHIGVSMLNVAFLFQNRFYVSPVHSS